MQSLNRLLKLLKKSANSNRQDQAYLKLLNRLQKKDMSASEPVKNNLEQPDPKRSLNKQKHLFKKIN